MKFFIIVAVLLSPSLFSVTTNARKLPEESQPKPESLNCDDTMAKIKEGKLVTNDFNKENSGQVDKSYKREVESRPSFWVNGNDAGSPRDEHLSKNKIETKPSFWVYGDADAKVADKKPFRHETKHNSFWVYGDDDAKETGKKPFRPETKHNSFWVYGDDDAKETGKKPFRQERKHNSFWVYGGDDAIDTDKKDIQTGVRNGE